MSEADYAILESKIRKAYGIPEHYVIQKRLGDYMRQAALRTKITDIKQLTDVLSLLRRELNHIGVNCNQLAHAANSQGYDSSIADDFNRLLDKTKKVLVHIVRDEK